jgi:threonine synthase
VLRYLETGEFAPVPSVATISNAMDVGNPSNFARMLELYDHAVSKMQHDVYGVRFRDDQTRQAIADVFEKYQYSMDPHGAVAYLGLASFQKEHDSKSTGIFIETAHPAKFAEVVEPIIGRTIPLPPQLAGYITREKRATLMNTELSELRAFLRDVY